MTKKDAALRALMVALSIHRESAGGEHGRENWAMAAASGQCAWCGWTESDRG